MKKNKKILIERHIYLERWLKENYPVNMSDSEILNYFMKNFSNKHDVEYLLGAYFLPKDEIEKLINGNNQDKDIINELCIRYSTDKNKIVKRIHEIKDINDFNREKLEKPKANFKYDNISEVIDNYINNSKMDELERKLILENWLKDNYILDEEKMINYIYLMFNNADAKYLTNAYFMPIDKVMGIIRKFNVNNNVEFEYMVNMLMEEYDCDRSVMINRIEEVIILSNLIKRNDASKSDSKKQKIKK